MHSRHWEAGVYGEFGYFGGGNLNGSDHALSAAAGLQGQYHLLPAGQYDPWVGLGVGWRGYWGHIGDNDYGLQGIDIVRVRAGVDYRLSPKLSAGPSPLAPSGHHPVTAAAPAARARRAAR